MKEGVQRIMEVFGCTEEQANTFIKNANMAASKDLTEIDDINIIEFGNFSVYHKRKPVRGANPETRFPVRIERPQPKIKLP